jgi:MFS family permease
VFTLARFSEALLILKAQSAGPPIALVPIIMVIMNIVYALVAYPAGALSDRIRRNGILFIGFDMLIFADLILAFGTTIPAVLSGVVFWRLHMGLTQGLLAALVADTGPEDMRGTAFGVFNLASGIALLIASVIAGVLWDAYGPRMTFLMRAGFTAIAMLGLLLQQRRAICTLVNDDFELALQEALELPRSGGPVNSTGEESPLIGLGLNTQGLPYLGLS